MEKTLNILVTGASKGIGRAIALEMSDKGNIFVTGRNEEALKTGKILQQGDGFPQFSTKIE